MLRNPQGYVDQIERLARTLLVFDEIGHLPFEPEAANLYFRLISAGYERPQPSTPRTSPSAVGKSLRRDTVAEAMIDRIVHHTKIHSMKAVATCLKRCDLGRTHPPPRQTVHPGGQFAAVTRSSNLNRCWQRGALL